MKYLDFESKFGKYDGEGILEESAEKIKRLILSMPSEDVSTFVEGLVDYIRSIEDLRRDASEEEIRMAQFREILGTEGYFYNDDEVDVVNSVTLETKFEDIVRKLDIDDNDIDRIFYTLSTFVEDFSYDSDDWESYDLTVKDMLGL